MNRRLIYWLVLDVIFVSVLVIALFFLDDPITKIFLGVAGAAGVIACTINIARVGNHRGP